MTINRRCYPLRQFLCLIPLPVLKLSGIKLITIFVSNNLFKHLDNDDLSPWFAIRTYKSLDDLVPCSYTSKAIKPFPLSAELVENDFPTWDNGYGDFMMIPANAMYPNKLIEFKYLKVNYIKQQLEKVITEGKQEIQKYKDTRQMNRQQCDSYVMFFSKNLCIYFEKE